MSRTGWVTVLGLLGAAIGAWFSPPQGALVIGGFALLFLCVMAVAKSVDRLHDKVDRLNR